MIDSHFYASSKSIHSQAKEITMDYCDQDVKNLDIQLVYLKGTGKLLVLWQQAFILHSRSLRMNSNEDSCQP